MPIGSSVRAQLRKLKKKHPAGNLKAIAGEIEIARHAVHQHGYPRLAELASAFQELEISAVLPQGVIVDGFFYNFWLQSYSLHRVQWQLEGYGPSNAKQPHALVQWAEAVRKACMEYLVR